MSERDPHTGDEPIDAMIVAEAQRKAELQAFALYQKEWVHRRRLTLFTTTALLTTALAHALVIGPQFLGLGVIATLASTFGIIMVATGAFALMFRCPRCERLPLDQTTPMHQTNPFTIKGCARCGLPLEPPAPISSD